MKISVLLLRFCKATVRSLYASVLYTMAHNTELLWKQPARHEINHVTLFSITYSIGYFSREVSLDLFYI